jgi:hypothetical protein
MQRRSGNDEHPAGRDSDALVAVAIERWENEGGAVERSEGSDVLGRRAGMEPATAEIADAIPLPPIL